MSLASLIEELTRARIHLTAAGARLGINAPTGALTPALRERIALHKPKLLLMLQETDGLVTRAAFAPSVSAGALVSSLAQERLWFLDRLDRGNPAYNIPAPLRIRGELETSALQASVNEIVRRHEMLRATFREVGGALVLVLAPTLDLALSCEDLGDAGPAEREERLQRALVDDARRPFDLERGPLIRASLVRLGPEDHCMMLTLHHAIADGWSINIIRAELLALYAAFLAHRPSPLAEPLARYVDYARWHRQRWASSDARARVDAFADSLGGAATELTLPFDRRRPAQSSLRGAHHRLSLSADLARALQASSRLLGVTTYVMLLTAFFALLHYYDRRGRIVIGTNVANRSAPELDSVVGFFANTLPIGVDLFEDPTVAELAARVREALFQILECQDLPIEKLVERERHARDPGRNPLFHVLFILQPISTRPASAGGIEIAPVDLDTGSSPFDISLHTWESAEGLDGAFRYDVDLFDAGTIRLMAQRFEVVVTAAVASPDARLTSLCEAIDEHDRSQQRRTAEQLGKRWMQRASAVDPRGPRSPGERATGEIQKSDRLDAIRKPVPRSTRELVEAGHLGSGSDTPLVLQPASLGVDLVTWSRKNRDLIEASVRRHGAVLLRGFTLDRGPQALELFAQATVGELIPYQERSSPRTSVGQNVYTATDHPPEEPIFLHNEQSYNVSFPRWLIFLCLEPPVSGGQTLLADSRKVFERIDPGIRGELSRRGYLLSRSFGDGPGLGWEEAFQTADRAVVEDYCRRNDISFAWGRGRRLTTRQVRRVMARHPVTDESVWFNHLTFFHVSTLPPETRDLLLQHFKPSALPHQTYYGDGEELEPEVLSSLRTAYREETVSVDWRAGDLLLLDNMLVSHGRSAFRGPRRLIVGMSTPTAWANLL